MDNTFLSYAGAMVLSSMAGARPGIAQLLLEQFSSPIEAIKALQRDSRFKSPPFSIEQASALCRRMLGEGYRLLSLFDPAYPDLLKSCPDAPILLYIKSKDSLEEIFSPKRRFISIIGTRDLSLYGKSSCRRIVEELSHCGTCPTVVSGLAIGADIAAHEAAMEYGLPTIAVLPGSIDNIYPRHHSPQAGRIASLPGSALVSEFPPGSRTFRHNFLQRNRIIAGMSMCTILVESKTRGGGMITAHLAAGYGREVYAVPGRIDDPRSNGCNSLIADKVAEILASPATLPTVLGLVQQSREIRSARPLENYLEMLEEEERTLAGKLLQGIRDHPLSDAEALCEMYDADFAAVTVILEKMKTLGIITSDLLGRCGICR